MEDWKTTICGIACLAFGGWSLMIEKDGGTALAFVTMGVGFILAKDGHPLTKKSNQ